MQPRSPHILELFQNGHKPLPHKGLRWSDGAGLAKPLHTNYLGDNAEFISASHFPYFTSFGMFPYLYTDTMYRMVEAFVVCAYIL